MATVTVVDVPPQFTPNSFTAPETYSGPSGSDFGESVASIYGNVAVGAPSYNGIGVVDLYDGVPTDTGGLVSTYVYGQLIHAFQDPNPVTGNEFGESLGVIGNDLVVGTTGVAGGNGVVYVFDANPNDTTFGNLLLTLAYPGSGGGAEFGAAVAARGTTLRWVLRRPIHRCRTTLEIPVYLFDGTTGSLLATITNPVPGHSALAHRWLATATTW